MPREFRCILYLLLLTGGLPLTGCGACRLIDPLAEAAAPTARLLPLETLLQAEGFEFGQTALAMLLNYWGGDFSPDAVAEEIYRQREARFAPTPQDLADFAKSRGYHAFLLQLSLEEILAQLDRGRPVIVRRKNRRGAWEYQVVCGQLPATREIIVADARGGLLACPYRRFRREQRRTEQFSLLAAK